MYYEIVEVSTAVASGHTYVLVNFWQSRADHDAAQPSFLTEEFLMQLRPTGRRVVTDGRGWMKRADGVFVDPETLDRDTSEPVWERETFTRDLPAEIRVNVERYWQNTAMPQKLSGDHTGDASKPLYRDGKRVPQGSAVVARDNSDPQLVLARADVEALRGATFESVL